MNSHPHPRSHKENAQRVMGWSELCCCLQLVWPSSVLCKWLNFSSNDSDYDADSRFVEDSDDAHVFFDAQDTLPRLRRRNSETFRSQYINAKDIRMCVGTWNIGGKLPPDDLDIDEWLDVDEPADIYVLGIQEIVPLNAGNIFGSDDKQAVLKWENIIRRTLSKVHQTKTFKSYSNPSSPSKFNSSDDVPYSEDKVLLEIDSDSEDNDRHMNEDPGFYKIVGDLERINPIWPEQPLNSRVPHFRERPSIKSFTMSKSFKRYCSDKLADGLKKLSEAGTLVELDLECLAQKRKKPEYVRIVSKQMVGIFLTIWVHRCLRKYIQNLKVSTVGVGFLGCLGNKGSVSASMSIYQTNFCFICTHLAPGEKEEDQLRRNADVLEIHRRTVFQPNSEMGVPKSIYDHERIIWLGDLNYRIDLPGDETRKLVAKEAWSKLVEKDQLVQEQTKGRVFNGWCEGILNFPPTYKYEINSDIYYGEDPKSGRRNPAWCDRILSFGKGIKLLNYRRSELKLSDHRPVTATYDVEVEVFSTKKLQRALTLTDTDIENEEILIDKRTSHSQLQEEMSAN